MDAVLRREWLRYQRAMGKAGLVRFVALYVVIFGFVLPNSFDNPAAAFAVFAFIPLYVAGPLAVDAFVGERERNTLETLLTAPFSPAKLLWGKALFPVLVSTATVWLVMLLFSSYRLITGGKVSFLGGVVAGSFGGVLSSFFGGGIRFTVLMEAKLVRSGFGG
ncbi:MAG: ABC transporter permease subunit, partial [FCB group bacterium]|nr:ABC transporter permease subunit [FCB group bacterium]